MFLIYGNLLNGNVTQCVKEGNSKCYWKKKLNVRGKKMLDAFKKERGAQIEWRLSP